MPGAVCPSVLEVEFLTPGGDLHIPVGSEVLLCYETDEGVRNQLGVFTVGDNFRPSPNRYRITAYDRLSWLDKDLTQWVDELDEWPYSLQEFAQMVCDACSLYLRPEPFTNGECLVHKFEPVSVTGRELMQWVGQLACRYCRVTADGEIALDWYTEANSPSFSGENAFVFQDSFSCADYLTDVIDKVTIRTDNKERGYSYGSGSNAYVITGNLLVSNASVAVLARTIYEKLCKIRYTPCEFTVPDGVRIECGDILRIKDRGNQEIVMYVMKKTQCGRKHTLECIGNPRRSNRM